METLRKKIKSLVKDIESALPEVEVLKHKAQEDGNGNLFVVYDTRIKLIDIVLNKLSNALKETTFEEPKPFYLHCSCVDDKIKELRKHTPHFIKRCWDDDLNCACYKIQGRYHNDPEYFSLCPTSEKFEYALDLAIKYYSE